MHGLLPLGLALAALGAAAIVVARLVAHVAAGDRARGRAQAADEQAHLERRHHARLPGATPQRAIEVASPAAVEPRAEAIPCPQCGGACRVEAHVVQFSGLQRLRVANVRCGQCGQRRPVYLRLREAPDVH